MQDVLRRHIREMKVPEWLEEITTPQQALREQAVSYAFTNMQNYKARAEIYAQKYNKNFPEFEKKLKLRKKKICQSGMTIWFGKPFTTLIKSGSADIANLRVTNVALNPVTAEFSSYQKYPAARSCPRT